MHLKRICKFAFILLIFFVLPGVAFCDQDNSPATFPKIHVPEPKYEFKTVVEGQNIIHGFVIQNKGSAILDILKVKPG
ncbi:MAG: hypothetical protein JRI91_13490 [Deltaproteobacteria bacterium]|nr:hypothetical protein [Deltaproteobacteria bacterium]